MFVLHSPAHKLYEIMGSGRHHFSEISLVITHIPQQFLWDLILNSFRDFNMFNSLSPSFPVFLQHFAHHFMSGLGSRAPRWVRSIEGGSQGAPSQHPITGGACEGANARNSAAAGGTMWDLVKLWSTKSWELDFTPVWKPQKNHSLIFNDPVCFDIIYL